MVQNILGLFSSKCGIDGDKESADLGGGKNSKKKFWVVGEEQGNPISPLDAQMQQGIGDPVYFPLKVGIGETAIVKEEKQARGILLNSLL